MPRMSCTFMEDGPHTKDEIIAAVDRGIICETYTNGQVQIGEGDYTFYVKNGWLVEGGKVTAPIKDVNIIGNGPESLYAFGFADWEPGCFRAIAVPGDDVRAVGLALGVVAAGDGQGPVGGNPDLAPMEAVGAEEEALLLDDETVGRHLAEVGVVHHRPQLLFGTGDEPLEPSTRRAAEGSK